MILDADMPGPDGFDLARRMREEPEWADIPILMVTGLDTQRDRLRAVEAGVNDFIAKPWEMEELHLRSDALLRLKSSMDHVKRERADLAVAVTNRTRELRRTLEDLGAAHRHAYQAEIGTIRSLVHAAEFKDVDTESHIDRIRWYADVLARGLCLAPYEIELIREATPMHDVGKIGIPDAILLKPGPLTTGERRVMETHTTIGARILADSGADVLRMAGTIALAHHERWDGRGYPQRIAGADIPLPARICAVADVFDALTMDRCYRAALPNAEVIRMMRAERGRHFDPRILDVLLENLPAMERIQEEYGSRTLHLCHA